MKEIFVLFILCFILIGCKKKEDVYIESYNNYETYKDVRFVNITFIDEEFLLKIAQHKGGSVEDKAYTIRVTMNRVWNDEFYEKYSEYTLTTVQDIVIRELYEVDGLTAFEFEEIIPDEDSFEAMQLVKQGFDNSNGSLEYKN